MVELEKGGMACALLQKPHNTSFFLKKMGLSHTTLNIHKKPLIQIWSLQHPTLISKQSKKVDT
jgi:hypothetical protein